MRTAVVLLSVLFALTDAGAQTPAAAEGPPDFQMVKYSWSKERIGWERDPFAAPVEDFNDMRGRVSRERRPTTALEERSAGAEKAAKARPAPPPRYAFNYKLSVQNTGSKTIRTIDWDYVFTDAATGEELGRREFTSTEKINPGKRKELSVFAFSPPAQRISVYSLGKNERDGMLEQVIVVRILYDDGSVWQAR
ncbi:MAG TPA: hypothetical protein VGW76_06280 [Pyrinomonadaceae bacterium]|nr:hypothetical protein [Pyrinomonadaceae bacterium]